MGAGLRRRGRRDRGEQGAAGLEDLKQANRARVGVGEDGAGWTAGTPRLEREGDVAVQRRPFRGQLTGVGEQVVAHMLDGLPAVPVQAPCRSVPVETESALQRADGGTNGKVNVVSGNRIF